MTTIAKASYAARRIGAVPALAALLAVAGVLAGCASSAPSTFTSQNYGYSAALPAGWSSHQAGSQWDGLGPPGFEDGDVDLFTGPNHSHADLARCGPLRGRRWL